MNPGNSTLLSFVPSDAGQVHHGQVLGFPDYVTSPAGGDEGVTVDQLQNLPLLFRPFTPQEKKSIDDQWSTEFPMNGISSLLASSWDVAGFELAAQGQSRNLAQATTSIACEPATSVFPNDGELPLLPPGVFGMGLGEECQTLYSVNMNQQVAACIAENEEEMLSASGLTGMQEGEAVLQYEKCAGPSSVAKSGYEGSGEKPGEQERYTRLRGTGIGIASVDAQNTFSGPVVAPVHLEEQRSSSEGKECLRIKASLQPEGRYDGTSHVCLPEIVGSEEGENEVQPDKADDDDSSDDMDEDDVFDISGLPDLREVMSTNELNCNAVNDETNFSGAFDHDAEENSRSSNSCSPSAASTGSVTLDDTEVSERSDSMAPCSLSDISQNEGKEGSEGDECSDVDDYAVMIASRSGGRRGGRGGRLAYERKAKLAKRLGFVLFDYEELTESQELTRYLQALQDYVPKLCEKLERLGKTPLSMSRVSDEYNMLSVSLRTVMHQKELEVKELEETLQDLNAKFKDLRTQIRDMCGKGSKF